MLLSHEIGMPGATMSVREPQVAFMNQFILSGLITALMRVG